MILQSKLCSGVDENHLPRHQVLIMKLLITHYVQLLVSTRLKTLSHEQSQYSLTLHIVLAPHRYHAHIRVVPCGVSAGPSVKRLTLSSRSSLSFLFHQPTDRQHCPKLLSSILSGYLQPSLRIGITAFHSRYPVPHPLAVVNNKNHNTSFHLSQSR